MLNIRVAKYNQVLPYLDVIYIDTTSRSKTWSRGLSPFFLGPVKIGNFWSLNMENAWQYSKVYPEHVDDTGKPTDEWREWAMKGWGNTKAVRYPMGKGRKPLYSWIQGRKLSYIEARKEIYIPLYSQAVRDTDAFKALQNVVKSNMIVCLRDFDGYDHKTLGMSYDEVINCESRKMGHAFVLAMMLEGKI